MNFFTSDLHFGGDARRILKREFRPFASPDEYMGTQIDIFNAMMDPKDDLYVIGDFINYTIDEKDFRSGLLALQSIHTRVHILIGNNEMLAIEEALDGDFKAFQDLCLMYGAVECAECAEVPVKGIPVFLTHKLVHARQDMMNLFGHTHNITGRFSPLGINVGIDTSHFQPYSEDDIYELFSQNEIFWRNDPNIWKSLWGVYM